jgi:hypothetical protein
MPTRHRLHAQEVAWSQQSGRAFVTALNSDASAASASAYWTVHCGDLPPAAGGAVGGGGSGNNTSSSSSSSSSSSPSASPPLQPGAPIPHGARVRLQHSAGARRWLMASPDHRSPMTANGEVSGYDEAKVGAPPAGKDVVWVVEWDGQGAAMPPPEKEDEEGEDGKEKGKAAAEKKKKAAAAAAKAKAPKQGYWGGSTVVRLKHASSGHWLSSFERARFGHPLTGQQEVSAAPGRPGGNEQWRAAEAVYLPVWREDMEDGGGAGGAGKADGKKKDEL